MKTDVSTQMLKKEQVCKTLGISERTLENFVRDNKFPPPVRVGKWCFWSPKVIDNWLQRQFSAQENWHP